MSLRKLANEALLSLLKGGQGSGNYNHEGRHGQVGGSLPQGASDNGSAAGDNRGAREAQPEYRQPPMADRDVKATASELFTRVKRDGGFTYQPALHKAPTRGFAVSIYPQFERVFTVADLTPEHVEAFIKEHRALLEKDTRAHLGGWHDVDAGKVYLDISVVVESGEEAAELCRSHGQEGYYDLEKGETVIVKDESERRKGQQAESRFDGRLVGGYGRGAPRDGGGIRQPPAREVRPAAAVRTTEEEALTGPALKGGAGSGNWGHAGRIGLRGGSMPRGATSEDKPAADKRRPTKDEQDTHDRQEADRQQAVKNEAARSAALATEADAIAGQPIEHAALIDSEGNVVMRKTGTDNQVSFTAEEARDFAGRTFVHNHPRGSSFSRQDISLALRNGMREIRAIGIKWDYIATFENIKPEYLKPIKDAKNLTGIEIASKAVEMQVYDEFLRAIRMGTMSVAQAEAEHYHEVWTRIAAVTGMTYKRVPRGTAKGFSKGGAGSGNWGHAGRPGLRGGSLPRGESASTERESGQRGATRLSAPEDKVAAQAQANYVAGEDIGDKLRETEQYKKWAGDWAEIRHAMNSSQGDGVLRTICEMQGYEGQPTAVSADEMDNLVKGGWREMFRGVSEETYAIQYIEGDLYYGYGVFGNGTYVAYVKENIDREYALKTAEEFAIWKKNTGEYEGAVVMRMALHPDARIGKYSELLTEMETERGWHGFAGNNGADVAHWDVGRFAAMKGYDAIEIEKDGYMVILNRTAMAVQTEMATKYDAQGLPIRHSSVTAKGLSKGGEGSGNWGHAGRIGLVGGSLPRGASSVEPEHAEPKAEVAAEDSPSYAGAKVEGQDVTEKFRATGIYQLCASNSNEREMADFGVYGDSILRVISEIQRFDGKPQIVSAEEMDKLVETEGYRELFRGLTEKQYCRQFQRGQLFYGKGCYGNGTYTTYVKEGDRETALSIAECYASGWATDAEDAAVLRMALRPDARVADSEEIGREMTAVRTQLLKEGKDGEAEMYRDVGHYAAMKGYDAIELKENGYMIVLNRTAVVVQDEMATEMVGDKFTRNPKGAPKKEEATKGLSKGGEGSGNWGHAGRIGLVGGSMPRGQTSGKPEGAEDERAEANLEESAAEAAVTYNDYVAGSDITEAYRNSKPYQDWAKDSTLRKRVENGSENGDGVMGHILNMQGFDGPPEVISAEEMDRRVQQEHWTELYRGVTESRFGVQFQSGTLFCGSGIYGNGTYCATVEHPAEREWAIGVGERYAAKGEEDDDGVVMRIALRPDAKVIEYDDLCIQMKAERLKAGADAGLYHDIGQYAAMKGYDAIEVLMESYMIIINRTAVAVQDEFTSVRKDGSFTRNPKNQSKKGIKYPQDGIRYIGKGVSKMRAPITREQVLLSRRAGRIMSMSPIRRLSNEDRAAFVNAVSGAASFEALDPKWRGIIKLAEAELEEVLKEVERRKAEGADKGANP